jgi:hypothetical protein
MFKYLKCLYTHEDILLRNAFSESKYGNLKMFGEIFKYLIRDSILLNQLFFPFSYKYLDSEKALRSKISS